MSLQSPSTYCEYAASAGTRGQVQFPDCHRRDYRVIRQRRRLALRRHYHYQSLEVCQRLRKYAWWKVRAFSLFVFSVYTHHNPSLVINPRMRHHSQLRSHLKSRYEDTYFGPDAIELERNSREFLKRMYIANSNAEYLCDFLRTRSVEGGMPSESIRGHVIKQVYYPKYISRDNYDICRRRLPTGELDKESGGYGALFSLAFTSMRASEAFFDALKVAKGPAVGTVFTSASPYTILCHSLQLEWAAQYGVDATLVRVSVGTEDREVLRKVMETALKAAEF